MTAFLPTVTLTDELIEALEAGTLTLQRGQWVTYQSPTGAGGGKGRLISATESGVRILWRMAHESFRSFCLRFRQSITKPPKRIRRNLCQLALELVERVKNGWLRRALDAKAALVRSEKSADTTIQHLDFAIAEFTAGRTKPYSPGREALAIVAKHFRWLMLRMPR